MPREAAERLEAALAKVSELVRRSGAASLALEQTTDPREVAALSARLDHLAGDLNAADNELNAAVAEWAERSAAVAIAHARDFFGPASKLAAALVRVDADTPSLRVLLEVVESLEITATLDPSSDAGKLAERVRTAVAELDLAHSGAGGGRAALLGGRRRA